MPTCVVLREGGATDAAVPATSCETAGLRYARHASVSRSSELAPAQDDFRACRLRIELRPLAPGESGRARLAEAQTGFV